MPFDVYPVKRSTSPEDTAEDIARKVNFAEEHGGRLVTSTVVYTDDRRPRPETFLVFEYEDQPPEDLPWQNRPTQAQIDEATEAALRGN